MDLQGVELEIVDWIDLAQDRDGWQALVNVVINFLVPYNVGNFSVRWGSVSFSWRTVHHRIVS
jgi:hypothetical protein